MSITRYFTVYLNKGISVPPVINVNQYDSGETWIFTLLQDNGSQYTPASGSIIGLKADGNAIANAATVNASGQIVVAETEQMTAAPGKAIFELSIDSGTHGTANFIVQVEKKPTDGAIFSESDLSLIQQAIDAVNPVVIADAVSDWMDDNLTPTTPVVDASLSVSGAAADAKVTGDTITDLKTAILKGGMPLTAYNTGLTWELQGINGSTGQNENNSGQCRIKIGTPIYAENDCVIKNLSTDFYMFFYKYSDSACANCVGELPQYFGTTLTSITLEHGYYYRAKAQKNPYTAMNSTVMASIISNISIEMETKITDNTADIEALETEVTANAAAIATNEDRFYLEYGINRNSGNDVSGYIDSDGSIKPSTAYWATDYCYIGDLDSVIFTCNAIGGTARYAADMAFMSTYDENKNFIERLYTTGQPTYTRTAGVYYIRFCVNPSVTENHMLTGGSDVYPAFIPYTAPQLKLKEQYYNSGSNWNSKKWAVVGDSITEYNAMANKHYFDYVSAVTGIETVNMGSSGTGYKRTENENKAFYQRILNVPIDADVVTIFGSGNDLNYAAMGFNSFAEALGTVTDSTTATICGCINKTIDNLYTVLPTVQLGIVTPCPWESMNPANVGNDMDLYSQAIIEICKRRGIPCLDLYHCSGLRPWDATYRTLCYSNDGGYGVHPNDKGHEIMAPHFKAFLDTLVI